MPRKNTTVDYYQGTEPDIDLKQFFTGNIRAWGIIQNWRRRVISRFDIDMVGTWQGNIGTLTEDFRYYSGQQQQRVWTINQQDAQNYQGTASDIHGKAIGKANGCAMHWCYVMDIPVGKSTYRLKFNDWMWAMHGDVVINRSYLSKVGITLAELTLCMQKQTEKAFG